MVNIIIAFIPPICCFCEEMTIMLNVWIRLQEYHFYIRLTAEIL